jgi:spermidine synthase
MRALVLLLFFFSGAAGLVYEVTWARSLGLVFGASHLAVATVLGVYMGGQALGAALFGPRVDRARRPLRLFGLLELGVAASAVAFLGLMRIYPAVYGPLARLADDGSGLYLTVVRTAFAVAALLVPTTLMGGTLPALVRFVARTEDDAGGQLSSLYAFNTFGAVTGVLAAGFVLLAAVGVTSTLLLAAATSAAVGIAALLLDRRAVALEAPAPAAPPHPVADAPPPDASALVARLTLAAIGVSGFCALGYEVLWTRMLTLVVGTSVHSFAIMLVAFLAGIGIGSHAFAVLARRRRGVARGAALAFAGTQVAIGVAALTVTVLMRDLPTTAQRVQDALAGVSDTEFAARLVASAGVAFAYMFTPAFFMGFAFPAAATIWSAGRRDRGRAVGRVLSVNTVGAILGAVVSGFVLVNAFGIERSLHMLVVLNVAAGLCVAAAVVLPGRRVVAGIAAVAAAVLVARGAFSAWGRVWDRKYFATYTNNTRSVESPEQLRDRLRDVDVLYYHEGVNETVSVIRPKGSIQTFIVNGRPEASTALMDVQLQRTLGHLPMLLHPDPRRVFVLGTGTGMTLGSASIHPEVERLVLGEIEEGMLGVARSFADWNSHVLDDPKLSVVLNDGRNFLATTREQFDVISADPIHPWSGGAGYLYTREYFRSVSDRLAPGGIACQWLPLYELDVTDVKTVVRTFAESFDHVMVWLTYYDAVLVGAKAPIVVDEAALARRMAVPAIRADLAPVQMGTPEDLLSFFVMGTSGARAFGRGGDVNTDDNLVLEFSAPRWQGVAGLEAKNVLALSEARESLAPYVAARPGEAVGDAEERWRRGLEAGRTFDRAHARFLVDRASPEMRETLAVLRARDAGYAPLRFLLGEVEFWDRTEPALVEEATFAVGAARSAAPLRIAAVRQFVGRDRVLVSFVDPVGREIYGQRYLDGEYEQLEGDVKAFVATTLAGFRAAAERASSGAAAPGAGREDAAALLREEAVRLVGRPLAERR